MKKKLTAVLLALTLACLALPGALAEKSYTLKDVGITVTLPENLVVMGPGMVSALSVAAEMGGVTVAEVEDLYEDMEKSNLWLIAMDMDQGCELDLGAEKMDFVTDLREWEESEQQAIYTTDKAKWEEIHSYPHQQAKFIRASLARADGSEVVCYSTIYDSWLIHISFLNYSGMLTDEQEQMLREVVDTLHFNRESVYTAPGNTLGGLEMTGGTVLFFNMLLTLGIYCLPLFIYRFGVRRAPMERKRAKKLVILYGIAAYLFMSVLMFVTWAGAKIANVAVAVLWCSVDYLFLTKGAEKKSKTAQPSRGGELVLPVETAPAPVPAAPSRQENAPGAAPEGDVPGPEEEQKPKSEPSIPDWAAHSGQQASSEPDMAREPAPAHKLPQEHPEEGEDIRFCRRCGARLEADSIFCHHCGCRVRKE